ncbi:hypothetical protein JK636_17435 [Clostridium sp. YIM B02515]|uniref:Uncharacterized protein n=1 Tax=Clostridium rhizosphaerae TaxID=2803861 RepID=A0ABS1TFW4_9CLOT|nr:hypothetical protein [Clostridium rhizosphaerae]MBL4937506.1 hypothetical protein [Clostridium rhizosphaerae]
MITKGLKNKIAAGVIAATLVGGTGTVFASTNAGAQLKTWYDVQFGKAVASATLDVTSYAKTKIPDLTSWFNTTKGKAVSDVKTAGENEEKRANDAINAALKEHTDAITTMQGTIEAGMPGQFDGFVTTSNIYIDGLAKQGQNYAQGEINKAVNNQAAASLSAVNTNVGATKTSAESTLTNTINTAKDSINGKIDTEKKAAVGEIKSHMDEKITNTEAAIEADTNKLVGDKTTEIQSAGKSIEDAAKTALDTLVAGITK